MSSRHGELEEFSCRGKQLLLELKKIPECDSQHIREDMDAILDQWLDVSLQSDAASSCRGHSSDDQRTVWNTLSLDLHPVLEWKHGPGLQKTSLM